MVSVCIATFNGEKFISEQIMSILKQIGTEDEIIVSDDGSTDNTIQIIKNIGDDRIRLINGPRRHSPIFNFENAIRNAKGEYIFLADQDDVWIDGKLKTFMHYLQTNACVISDNIVVNGNLDKTSDSFYCINRTHKGRFYNLLVKNGYLGCCMAFQRKILEYALPFPKDIPMHDIWIGNVSAFYFNVKFIPEKLILFRRHGNNASHTAAKSIFSLKDMLRFRYLTLKNLILIKLKK